METKTYKIKDYFTVDPSKNTNKYDDYIKYGSEAAHSLADTPLTDPKSFLYAIIRFSLKEAYPHKFFQ